MQSELSKFYPILTGTQNEVLRRISTQIASITPEIVEFGEDLLEIMYENDGVGLAAPQVGKNIRMIAVTSRKKNKKDRERASETIMINPTIINKSQEMVVRKEACLSVPDVIGYVKRHKNIEIEYTDLKGQKKIKKLRDYNSVIVQHEIDHLDGILFVDKLVDKKIKK